MQINSKKLKLVEKPIRFNEDFIKILEELKNIMILQGEPFRAKAYQKAMENIIMFKDNITNPNEQLKNVPGIGITILEKLNEFKETGTLKILERERNNPLNILTKVYGIGPKKARELIGKDITTIDHLRKNTQELNDKQIIGLKYFDDIIQRIPRSEIEIFNQNLTELFKDPILKDSKFNIVGSFRRGHANSGDIDVIISDSYNFPNSFDVILDKLIENKIIIEVLSRGKIKCLTIIRGIDGDDSPCRRADFLYSDPKEYAFAQLYFTGSKIFNTFMRQRALDLGYTLNEHGISKMEKGVKTKGVEEKFENEEDIFNFLGMKYKIPEERIDGRSVEILNEEIKEKNEIDFEEKIEKKMNVKIENKKMAIQHNKTLKIVPNDPFKKQIQKIKKEGITAIKLMTENELTKLIHKANDAYYCDEDPILDDNLYDILINYIQKKYPHNNIGFSNHTGCNVEVKKNKVELPYQLWSMDKVKPHTGAVLKWAMKFQGPYIVSCKLDGVSGLYIVNNGKRNLYTRGNGTIGQDVSHMIDGLNLPNFDGMNIAIRGEFIITKSKFNEKYKQDFSNPRNFVAGVVNQKTIDNKKLADIDFVAYEVINPELKPSEQMKFLQQNGMGIKNVTYQLIESNKLNNEFLSDLLLKWREESEYEIDGIIIVNNKIYPRPTKNPEYAIAFKMIIAEQMAETRVIDVLWTPSKDGYLKPRIQIEPVILGGAKIEFATGFNAKFIVDNEIGIGVIVRVIRSGDVIPHIEAVLSTSDEISLPDIPYKWNETGVDIIIDNKNDNEIVQHKNITGFFKQLEVEGLASGNIKKIMNAGFDTIPKIIAMEKNDFLQIDGFKEKLAEKIYTGIKQKIDDVSLPLLMSATNIFGRGMGEKRFKAILKEHPEFLQLNIPNNQKINMLMKIDSFASKTAEKFVDGIPTFIDFMEKANLNHKLNIINIKKEINSNQSSSNSAISGKKIVMTGFRDKEIIKWIESNGGIMGSSVSSNTDIVLVRDKDETTGKAEQARKAGIPLMTPDEFTNKYM